MGVPCVFLASTKKGLRMKRRLLIQIEAGDLSCFDFGANKMCPHMTTERMGSRWVCGIFGVELRDHHDALSGDGILQRAPECLAVEDPLDLEG